MSQKTIWTLYVQIFCIFIVISIELDNLINNIQSALHDKYVYAGVWSSLVFSVATASGFYQTFRRKNQQQSASLIESFVVFISYLLAIVIGLAFILLDVFYITDKSSLSQMTIKLIQVQTIFIGIFLLSSTVYLVMISRIKDARIQNSSSPTSSIATISCYETDLPSYSDLSPPPYSP